MQLHREVFQGLCHGLRPCMDAVGAKGPVPPLPPVKGTAALLQVRSYARGLSAVASVHGPCALICVCVC